MPLKPDFPHLNLSYIGTFEPTFPGGPFESNPEVEKNLAKPALHAGKLQESLGKIRTSDAEFRAKRVSDGLPDIPAGKGFLLRLPEGVDVDQLASQLGLELVAETDKGFMLVASEDLAFSKFERVLGEFASGSGSKTIGSAALEIFDDPNDPKRLEHILSDEVRAVWPLADSVRYIFDIGIQTAESTRSILWPRVIKRKAETVEKYIARKEHERRKASIAADERWLANAEARNEEVETFIKYYDGQVLRGMVSNPPTESRAGVVFPDSVQIRVQMLGSGFRDLILNFPHLFEVSIPPEVEHELPGDRGPGSDFGDIVFLRPDDDAPTVCVIDSGIQENHKWLTAAIDATSSKNFVPGLSEDDVADYVSPRGHGTRVAGAILYPTAIPKSGTVELVTRIQNARVLDANNELPRSLSPEKYLEEVVQHFHAAPHYTEIFNHSINSKTAATRKRMSAWAAKIDHISYEYDVLFVQSTGNRNDAELKRHLVGGDTHPGLLLTEAARIANPAQSLHALTVGSISAEIFEDEHFRSFVTEPQEPSGFSRTGYAVPWSVIKPDVVEVGGDFVYSKFAPFTVKPHTGVSLELLNSTMFSEPAFSKDGCGTSFAAPKVTHLAALLKRQFPTASPLLCRALIVQSAQWPGWAEKVDDADKVLRLIGYGIPSADRALDNTPYRVTLVTPEAELIQGKKFHLYRVRIPDEIRNAALEARIRIEITLAYTAMPRRTRLRRASYLETWLDWECSRLGEPSAEFQSRMEEGGKTRYADFPWKIHKKRNIGEAEDTSRTFGTAQKDWADFNSFDLPEEFCIAVRGHKGWNHRDEAGSARYCLVVSFEAMDTDLPIYVPIESLIEVEEEVRVGEEG